MTAAAGGILAGRSPRTGSATGRSPLELLAKVGPFVFLAGLLALLSLLVSSLVDQPPGWEDVKARVGAVKTPEEPGIKVSDLTKSRKEANAPEAWTVERTQAEEYVLAKSHPAIRRQQFFEGLGAAEAPTLFRLLIASGVLALVMAWRVDINVFSLNALYGNRLVRCYLGASRSKAWSARGRRTAPPFTARRPTRCGKRTPSPVSTPWMISPCAGS